VGTDPGYYRKRDDLPITLVPLPSEPGAARMEYHIAMGVRANEPEWRRRIQYRDPQAPRRDTAILATTASACSMSKASFISP